MRYEVRTDILYAGIENRLGAGIYFFYYNPDNWDPLPPNVKFFAYYHELCHIYKSNSNEQEESPVDCCALEIMRRENILSDVEVLQIYELLGKHGKRQRQLDLLNCFVKISAN